ncbi:MAG: hypothetical protein HY067_09585 [Betaproteobacteria bacterium]|nr:hypothetical protein [Betaproteobacteria bacterium]
MDSTFAARLRRVLEFDGVVSVRNQGRRIAAAGVITRTTARRWLVDGREPRSAIYATRLAMALDVSLDWLVGLELPLHADTPERWAMIAGMDPRAYKFEVWFLRQRPEHRAKLHRMIIRLTNDNGKAWRLVEACARGYLSYERLLEAMWLPFGDLYARGKFSS